MSLGAPFHGMFERPETILVWLEGERPLLFSPLFRPVRVGAPWSRLLLIVACMVLAFSSRAAEEREGALEVADALRTFQLPADLILEVVAAEPMVTDPVAIAFDERQRLYVVEYRDYPLGPGEGTPPLSRIKLLEDRDGDGRMDSATIFAEGLSFAQGVLPWNGGLVVTAAPEVLFLKDTSGDGKADVREILYRGFTPGNPQLRVAHPRLGLDNWIYLTNGLSNGEVTSDSVPGASVPLQGHDFRFHPITRAFEPATGFGQFGNTFDDWGNRFFCSNRNPTMVAILPYSAMTRNPYAMIGKGYEDVADFGGDAKVYPIVPTATTAFEHTGTHTAACGVWVHRGNLLGPQYTGGVYVCEPTGHLVTRSTLQPAGTSFRVERAVAGTDFLASTDKWFRPVSLADGPDGALYVVDMYRQVIEHPQYMPPGLAETLNLRAGEDRGRIYRIRAMAQPASQPFSVERSHDWVKLLTERIGWRRDLGQRLLISRKPAETAPPLKEMLVRENSAVTRIHVLWTLEGLGWLTLDDLQVALRDSDPRVQAHAVRVSWRFLEENPSLVKNLGELAISPDARVRFEVALALGESSAGNASQSLVELARRDYRDPWLARAVLASARDRSGYILSALVMNEDFVRGSDSDKQFLVRSLASSAGARGDRRELRGIANLLGSDEAGFQWWHALIISGLAEGFARHQGEFAPLRLARLLDMPPPGLSHLAERIRVTLGGAVAIARDDARPTSDRAAAARLLGYLPFAQSSGTVRDLLALPLAQEIQTSLVQALRTSGDSDAGPLLLEHWSMLGPESQKSSLDFLLEKPTDTRQLLEAMEAGKVPLGVLDLERRTRVLASGNPPVREIAQRVLGSAASADRQAVLDGYASTLKAQGDAARGNEIFKRTCANCHRVRGEGHSVGPDLSDVRNKTAETLLADILDPNRAVEPRFVDYVVATDDGRVFTGLLVQESDQTVTLRRAEGKEEVIPRGEIETLRATGRSVMPEGMEKELSIEQMADLIAFLRDGLATNSGK